MEDFVVTVKSFADGTLGRLQEMRRKGKHCDVRIVCQGGVEIPVHKPVLLSMTGDDDCPPKVTSQETAEVVTIVVDYLYTGYINVKGLLIPQFIRACREFKLHDIVASLEKRVAASMKKIARQSDTLKSIDFETMKSCVNIARKNNEFWVDVLSKWCAADQDKRKKEYGLIVEVLNKFPFKSSYRHSLFGGHVIKYDGEVVRPCDGNWLVKEPYYKVVILNIKNRRFVSITEAGEITVIEGTTKKIHGQKAFGLCEVTNPPILWLSSGKLVNVVDKPDPFEDLNEVEKVKYSGSAWTSPPAVDRTAQLLLGFGGAVFLNYDGVGSSYISSSKGGSSKASTAGGVNSWKRTPCTDITYAFLSASGSSVYLLCQNVMMFDLWSTKNMQAPLSTAIQGECNECPFIVPCFSDGSLVVVATVDMIQNPKAVHFRKYDLLNKTQTVISDEFDVVNEANLMVI